MRNLINSQLEWAVETPAQTFPREVQAEVERQVGVAERAASDEQERKRARNRRMRLETALVLAWENYREHFSMEDAVEELANLEDIWAILAAAEVVARRA